MRRLGSVLAILAVAVTAAGAPARPVRPVAVVVQGRSAEQAAAAVRAAGGRVTRPLPVVDGVAAQVPPAAVATLTRTPGIAAVTPDAAVRVSSVYDPGYLPGWSRPAYLHEVQADNLQGAGTTGRHVRVALIDTGIAEVPDLSGRIVPVQDPDATPSPLRGAVSCVDLSGDGDCVDRYGHGTFIAGLIAGNGAQSNGRFAGVAPEADLVSVKIAGRSGASDVSKVLAAIQWVVSFRDTYDIRVLNLSLGTNSPAPYWVDPLNRAVERAWQAGIVVVVAAGNSGPANGTVAKPGDDPLVITAGAVDDRMTSSYDDDRLPNFSSRGPTHDGIAKPDVVAPGARLVSLRLADSTIETQAGPGLMAAAGYPAYRMGSGTSMATAVVSGGAALLVQRHPDWTPDRVKYALKATAQDVATNDRRAVGEGIVRFAAADRAWRGVANGDVHVLSDGSGALDAARGDVHVGACASADDCARCEASGDCTAVAGDLTSQGRPYQTEQYAQGTWDDTSWYASQWEAILSDPSSYGNSWLGNSWLGNSWLGNSWLGSSFYGTDDAGDDYGRPAKGGAWYGAWK